MVKVDKVFKESEYYKNRPITEVPESPKLGEFLMGNLGQGNLIEVFNMAPAKNALAIVGVITVLYIGFKVASKFVKIKRALEKD